MNYCLNFCHNCDYIFENYYRAKIFDIQYNYGNELLIVMSYRKNKTVNERLIINYLAWEPKSKFKLRLSQTKYRNELLEK